MRWNKPNPCPLPLGYISLSKVLLEIALPENATERFTSDLRRQVHSVIEWVV